MEYAEGRAGRVFVARMHEGEDIYACLEGLAREEGVKAAVCYLVGGIARGKVVVGPEEREPPLRPVFRQFDDARELVGVGTIFWNDAGPKLHLHAGIGRGDDPIVGCPRGGAEVFLVLEAVIMEILGVGASRAVEPGLDLALLHLTDAKTLKGKE